MCCKPAAERAAGNAAYPFCSERCRLVDLGKWLGEEYRVPAEEPEAGMAAEGEAPAPGDDEDAAS